MKTQPTFENSEDQRPKKVHDRSIVISYFILKNDYLWILN